MDIIKLKSWFLKTKRSFPWRGIDNPYAVWVSEIMLQQTLASVVVPYFTRWISLFPDIPSLANASKEDVIKAWEGLGYYSRARNLHAGAKHLLAYNGGVMPSTLDELLRIPGIGDYTAGAILNFAFGKKAPAIDGNVTRVIARILALDKEVTTVKKEIRLYVETILPETDPHIISEALIELGALVCKKAPECVICPLRQNCNAYQNGQERLLPVVKQREKTIFIDRIVLVIEHKGNILLRKGAHGQIMQDLYEFPFFEEEGDKESNARRFFETHFNFQGELVKVLKKEKHTFTKYNVTLHPFYFSAKSIHDVEGYVWMPIETLHTLPFSSGHRRLLKPLNTS